MSSYFCLISNSTQRHSYEFFINSSCYRTCQRCFSYSRRSYKTKYWSSKITSHGLYSKVIYYPVLNFSKTIMIFIQNPFCFFYIIIVDRRFFPWKPYYPIYIVPYDSTLCTHRRHHLHFFKFFFCSFSGLHWHSLFSYLVGKLCHLVLFFFAAKFFLYRVYLFVKIIFLLILLHLLLYSAFDLLFKLEYFHFCLHHSKKFF